MLLIECQPRSLLLKVLRCQLCAEVGRTSGKPGIEGGPTRQFLLHSHEGLPKVLVPSAQALEFVKVFEALLPAVLELVVPLVNFLHQGRH